jgi:hypothetical protein
MSIHLRDSFTEWQHGVVIRSEPGAVATGSRLWNLGQAECRDPAAIAPGSDFIVISANENQKKGRC